MRFRCTNLENHVRARPQRARILEDLDPATSVRIIAKIGSDAGAFLQGDGKSEFNKLACDFRGGAHPPFIGMYFLGDSNAQLYSPWVCRHRPASRGACLHREVIETPTAHVAGTIADGYRGD